MPTPLLRRFWLEFESHDIEVGYKLGCGITAFSEEDALDQLRRVYPKDIAFPTIGRLVADIDLSRLDANHVLPNIGDPTRRGVWFPRQG